MKQPYKQGILDGMCGFYCIINALHYLKPNMSVKRSEIFLKSMVKFKKKSFSFLYLNGTYFKTIVDLLEFSLTENEGFSDITYKVHFEDDVFEDHYEYLACLGQEINYDNTAAIISIGHPWHHWTVATKVNENTEKLHVFDSYYDSRTIPYKELSLKRKKNRLQLYTHETIVLTKR